MLDFKGNWNDYIALMEFAYNNSYQTSIRMAPSKLCVVEDVKLRCVGLKWVKDNC